MLLKSLKLKDFRQFKGEQYVSFANDPERNVTIIMGENGSGKTSFAQAFRWCLYGETDFQIQFYYLGLFLKICFQAMNMKFR